MELTRRTDWSYIGDQWHCIPHTKKMFIFECDKLSRIRGYRFGQPRLYQEIRNRMQYRLRNKSPRRTIYGRCEFQWYVMWSTLDRVILRTYGDANATTLSEVGDLKI